MTKKINVALAGNPNVGKTSLFNAITGSKQHVGNWPGVTVEKKMGKRIHNGTTNKTDTTMRNVQANVDVPHAGTAGRKRLDQLHRVHRCEWKEIR